MFRFSFCESAVFMNWSDCRFACPSCCGCQPHSWAPLQMLGVGWGEGQVSQVNPGNLSEAVMQGEEWTPPKSAESHHCEGTLYLQSELSLSYPGRPTQRRWVSCSSGLETADLQGLGTHSQALLAKFPGLEVTNGHFLPSIHNSKDGQWGNSTIQELALKVMYLGPFTFLCLSFLAGKTRRLSQSPHIILSTPQNPGQA